MLDDRHACLWLVQNLVGALQPACGCLSAMCLYASTSALAFCKLCRKHKQQHCDVLSFRSRKQPWSWVTSLMKHSASRSVSYGRFLWCAGPCSCLGLLAVASQPSGRPSCVHSRILERRPSSSQSIPRSVFISPVVMLEAQSHFASWSTCKSPLHVDIMSARHWSNLPAAR